MPCCCHACCTGFCCRWLSKFIDRISCLQPSSSGMSKATLPLAVGWSRCRSRYELGSSLSHADPHGGATCSARWSTSSFNKGACPSLHCPACCLPACSCSLALVTCLLCAVPVQLMLVYGSVSRVLYAVLLLATQEQGPRLLSRKIKSGLFPGFHFSRTWAILQCMGTSVCGNVCGRVLAAHAFVCAKIDGKCSVWCDSQKFLRLRRW